MSEANETVRRLAAFGVGAAMAYAEPEVQTSIAERLLAKASAGGGSAGAGAGSSTAGGDWTLTHGLRIALYATLRYVKRTFSPRFMRVTRSNLLSRLLYLRPLAFMSLPIGPQCSSIFSLLYSDSRLRQW
jgi:hypothetical protein